MRALYLILFLLLLVPPISANGMEIVSPIEHHHIKRNVHIIVDMSGSMSPAQINEAVAQALAIASQPSDDFNVAITAFAKNWIRMATIDEECDVGPNWMAMPSADNVAKIQEWFGRINTPEGDISIDIINTFIREPLVTALTEEVEDLSIIVISDCHFNRGAVRRLLLSTPTPVNFVGIHVDGLTKRLMVNMLRADSLQEGFVNIRREE